MALCKGTSGTFFCPNSFSFNQNYCCGIPGVQTCCDYETYSNLLTNAGKTIMDGAKGVLQSGTDVIRNNYEGSSVSFGGGDNGGEIILSLGAIIGIAIGALLLIIGLFVCCCWCCSCCCFANRRRQPGMVVVPVQNPITIMNAGPPSQGYSRLVENYGGELQSVAAQPPPYVSDYPADPHGGK